MDLEPRLLRYFIAVAQERNFSRAAQRLHISQPPLSYAIRQLETQLGARLFERSSRHVALTDAGRVLYGEALSLLRQGEEVGRLVRRAEAGLQGRLRIGFVGSMLYRGLPDLLAALRSELPDVEQVLAERNSHDQLEALRRGELDLGFIHANPPPEGVSARDLVAEPFVVCLPDTHRLAGRRSLRLADLAGEDFVFFAQAASPSYYETVLSLCVAAGFHPAVRHEVRHWLSVAALVASGLGVSIVPACLARAGLAGTCYVAFEHQARSVCQIAWPSLAPTSLQATALQAALRHFAPPPVRA
ncbi:putative LysR-family transcriptional regulator [Bordetella bronchiseptica MO149]|uniref:LysR substrate-binding domain-containing protein n=1 Tax=Bordetella bronchiseptica TaxID=518 RepID=UPI00028A75A3|nr:LysR substrate-binding domain-containing protein [Bordetella bronchiseptica]AUL16933.1 LysR family transcriptional regulator [Bordetella bronchiseptica]AWP60161.1 LysR family transcriptional regulator [Bordetella bronchiseptica]KAK72041.1 LysR substrate-binding domain protein [Bordetella bronchiseptica CA90 BB02]KDC27406.1 LysR substrate-binding domain protein [Bordetella bronchiseptica F4563]CCJ60491.1 putative LysR-family transcriptional regulator [Bordetella bronchiseptica MO149]